MMRMTWEIILSIVGLVIALIYPAYRIVIKPLWKHNESQDDRMNRIENQHRELVNKHNDSAQANRGLIHEVEKQNEQMMQRFDAREELITQNIDAIQKCINNLNEIINRFDQRMDERDRKLSNIDNKVSHLYGILNNRPNPLDSE